MFHRKLQDEIRVKRLWWVEPSQRIHFRKNRKPCSCPMCGNPRKYKIQEHPPSDKRKILACNDEINEFLRGENFEI